MNFITNLFLIGAASGELAGSWSRVKRSRWFILAGVITAAALMAVLLAPMEQKTFGADERLAQVQTPKAVAKQLVREPAVAGLFYPKDPGRIDSRMIDRLCSPPRPSSRSETSSHPFVPMPATSFPARVAAYSFKNLVGRRYDTVIIWLRAITRFLTGRRSRRWMPIARHSGWCQSRPKPGRWPKNQSVPQRALLSRATSALVATVI